MKDEIKLLASEVTLTSATNFSENTRIRIQNANAIGGDVNVITHKDSGGNTIGTVTLLPQQKISLAKAKTDTLEATNANCLAVAVFDVDGA
tara:strand:+ start:2428 stop:2700 length:273 start_codon:yes stop_codon:yes gene_type:complete